MPTRYFSGWRAGLARCTAVASIVTAINITFLLVAIPRLSISASGSSEGALFSGDCKRAKQLSIWLHLAINILATALLAAGNYTQQVLTAPTRSEINIGHSQERWLDIGVSSLHNLRQISGKRVAAWILLALTSVPIHLFYNSTISFKSGVNRYSIYPAMWDDLNDPDHQFHDNRYKALRNTLDEFERLENHECIAAYGPEFISDRSDVILILDPSTPDRLRNYTSVAGGDPMDYGTSHNTWICRQGLWSSCGDMSLTNAKNWSIYAEQPDHYGGETLQVEYCLSKRTPEHCKLILSIPLLGVVVGCNLFKLVGLALTWLCLENRPLLTLGDAIHSFLEHPDLATNGLSLLSKLPGQPLSWEARPRMWLPTKHRWAASITRTRYAVTMSLCIVTIVVASILLTMGMQHIGGSTSLVELWNRGFGRVSLDTLIDFREIKAEGLISMVLISNLPQLILSLLYAALNCMWTAMLVGVEWNSYGSRHKSLRTTYPVGHQRKTYWLSLPLRYGAPLIAGSATMHWFISQSIFFVRLALYQDEKRYYPREGNITTCGYSPIAIIFSIGLGSLILLITVAWSLRTMKSAIPLGGTCSAVVSAACHSPEGDEHGALELVKWGVVHGEDGGPWERCSITSWPAEAPEYGRWYR
ncbi:hypothetical protein IWW34DRAFT_693993 [Fusarium oxysporum f. sp. albedinis]|nr:hypothetical protein IWW34DRAFT_693993 [Fusarium oxysporum f. sp. albedinis]